MITYCTRCVMPSTKPDLQLHDDGVCAACRNFESRLDVDWESRREQFADVMDRYGRLLGYVKPDQPDVPAEQRLGSYNERLLAAGWASPYFIWPNTSPWRAAPAIVDAVPAPGTAAQAAAADPALAAARASVKAARRLRIGLYEAARPLRLQAFELRMLARRLPPDRWLVDLGGDGGTLIPPQCYPRVPLPEDRLFIPAEYVPLWVERGWQRPRGL